MTRPFPLRGLAAAGLLISGLATPAHAQDGAALKLQSLAASCAACHGTAGHAAGGGEGAMPSLAGLDAAYITTQMQALRDGKRPATVMHQIAKGYSDAQIAALAGYFAAQKK